jgi:PAS domain S-box-containing protein
MKDMDDILRRFFDSSVDLLFVADFQGSAVHMNGTIETLLGYTAEEIKARDYLSFIHPDDVSLVIAAIQKGAKGETVERLECRHHCKTGGYKWLRWHALPDLERGLFYATGRDVTRERERERLLETILNKSTACIFAKDLEGRYLLINHQFEQLFHVSRERVIGKTDHDIFPADMAAAFQENDRKVLASGAAISFQELVPQDDGSHYYIADKFPMLSDEGVPEALCGIATDISEMKRVEDKLRVSLKEIEDLKSALDEHAIVAITDSEGQITYVNDKFCAISGYSREELLGQDHRIINSGHHSKEFMADLWKTISSGTVWHGEMKNKARDGSIYWVNTTIVPFLSDSGQALQYVAIHADITERVTIAENLRRSNDDLKKFASVASHDLQEPLRMVTSYLQLLERRYKPLLDGEAFQFIDFAVQGAARMRMLIKDLLTYSRVDTQGVPLAPVDAGAVLESVLRNLKVAIEESGALVSHGLMPTVMADATQLGQVFQNLIANAIKFRGPNSPQIHIEATKIGLQWVFSVRDNGIGIEPRFFERIFVIFQRLHSQDEHEGTGIGLAVCNRIIARHGGQIWVESKPDEGSTFFFSLNPPNGKVQTGS